MRDPGARAGAHHGLERSDEAARRPLQPHAAVGANVDIGLAVGDRDHVVAVQLAAQRGAQRLLVPDPLAAVERPVLPLEVADQLAQIARDRPQLGRGPARRRTEQAFAAKQRAQAADPSAPGYLRNDERDQRDRRAERDEEIEEILARLLVAPLDEAHVVDECQPGWLPGVGIEPMDRHVEKPLARPHHAAGCHRLVRCWRSRGCAGRARSRRAPFAPRSTGPAHRGARPGASG